MVLSLYVHQKSIVQRSSTRSRQVFIHQFIGTRLKRAGMHWTIPLVCNGSLIAAFSAVAKEQELVD
jgi:hypothetical protein